MILIILIQILSLFIYLVYLLFFKQTAALLMVALCYFVFYTWYLLIDLYFLNLEIRMLGFSILYYYVQP